MILRNVEATLLDRLVGWAFPSWGARRSLARAQMYALRATAMDAANTLDRLRAARAPPEIGPEKETELARAKLIAVGRQLDRNNSWAAGVFRSITDNIVGEGISPESVLKNRSGGFRTRLNRELEDAWERWAEKADVTGKRSYYELEAQSEKELWIAGEVLLIKTTPRDREPMLALELVESERLADVTETAENGNKVKQGIEFNSAREPTAYYIWPNHPSDSVTTEGYSRIPVKRVLHVFEQYRPRAIRGLSRLAPVSRTFEALAQYLDFELARARISSAFVGAIKKTGTNYGLNFPSTGDSSDLTDAQGNPVGYMEGGMILNLRQGEDMTFSSPRIETAFEPFVTLMLRSIAVGLNVSYELLARDFSKTNYSSARQSALEDRKHWRPRQKLRLRQWSNPAWEWFTTQLKLQNLIPGLDTLEDLPVSWKLPGWQWIDPSKEIKAVVEEILAGTRAPQDVLAERGLDWHETLEKIAEAQQEAEELGVSLSWMGSGSNGNGAAPGKEESASQETGAEAEA